MQKTAQSRFTGGTASPDTAAETQPSMLADWNSYAAGRSDASSSSPLPFDIEAVVRSANNTASGAFSLDTHSQPRAGLDPDSPPAAPPTQPRLRASDAEDGAVLVHRRDGHPGHRRGGAALPPGRLELLRRRPLRRLLLLLSAPLRHRGRRPLRQRHRLRHIQRGEQGRAGPAGELPGRHGRVPVGEGAHVLRPLPRHRHLLRLHRLHALPPRHGAHAAEVRHLLHARLRTHHRLPLRAQGARQPARAHDLQRETTVYSGVHWMHGWHDLCLYGASQLFSVGDILDPSGSGSFLLHHILLPWRL